MARPNPDGKLNVLICDRETNILEGIVPFLTDWFGGKKEFTGFRHFPDDFHLPDLPISFDSGNFEITFVREIESVAEVFDSNALGKSPYYSCIIYSSRHIDDDRGGKTIARIRARDAFIPQMIVGTHAEGRNLMKAARAGCHYYAKNDEEFLDNLNKIFRKPTTLPGLTVMKIGGSSFDFDRQNQMSMNLEYVCQKLSSIRREKVPKDGSTPANRILLSVGAGQFGDVVKDHIKKYKSIDRVSNAYPEAIAGALQSNLRLVYSHIGKENASLIDTAAFYFIGKKDNKIPLISIAPHYILARDEIPLQDSDTHTIALAEFFGAKRVVLVKRTDGIYDFDPYRGFELGLAEGKCKNTAAWIELQKSNKRYGVVSVDDMLSGGFSREGTDISGKADGSQGHLMEDSALEYFKYCNNVREICVVHIAPEEMHYHAGGNNYRHAITGEKIALGHDGWKGVLEQRVRGAVKEGKCFSKIVK